MATPLWATNKNTQTHQPRLAKKQNKQTNKKISLYQTANKNQEKNDVLKDLLCMSVKHDR